MRLIEGIPVFGEPEKGALEQIKRCARTASHVALMADNHLGYAVPIGGVVAYESQVSPSGVGFDIACGTKAVRIDVPAGAICTRIGVIMDDIVKHISFGMGRKNNVRVDHDLFDDPAWACQAISPLKEMARQQLGTVGGGNHYVDVFVEDGTEAVWVGVHFGSRGLGHKTATHFLKAAGAKDGIDVDPCVLPVDSDLGAQYIECMELGGRYAYAGRDWVCAEVARIIGANIVEEVHNHHNFAWKEKHAGQDLWVVRKGATPAFPGQKGFVGGTMGGISVILEGVDHPDCAASLYSTVHGAGRVLSRTAASGKTKRSSVWSCGQRGCDGELPIKTEKGPDGSNPKCPKCGSKTHKFQKVQKISDGLVDWGDCKTNMAFRGIELRGAGADEAPQCYKNLADVLEAHGDSIKILSVLRPIGVAMAGSEEVDPYRD